MRVSGTISRCPSPSGETGNREPAHDLQGKLERIIGHVDVRLSAPTSSSALGLHGPLRAWQPVAPSLAGLGPQLPRPAYGPQLVPQTRLGHVAGGGSRSTAAWSRSCVVADGVVMQSGYPVRPMNVPNESSPHS